MSILTLNRPAVVPPQFVRIPRPRTAGGVGDIADAVMGLATTALQIAAAERQAALQKKQAEAAARLQRQVVEAQAYQAQQAQEQARLAEMARLEALRNSAAPASMQGYPQAPGGSFSVGGLSLPSWSPWALLALAVAVAAGRSIR